MQSYLLAAAILAVIVGLVHSVLGEILIFRHLRDSGLVPDREAPPLEPRHVRIIWASWHAVTVFGWAFAGVLLAIASPGYPYSVGSTFVHVATGAFVGAALLVLVGTRGRHPGWLGLSVIAALTLAAGGAA